uniref:Transposase n=1 Tax=Panagrellus redivivus TaxID=6233 RepID=A0A7E4VGE7_PANRE
MSRDAFRRRVPTLSTHVLEVEAFCTRTREALLFAIVIVEEGVILPADRSGQSEAPRLGRGSGGKSIRRGDEQARTEYETGQRAPHSLTFPGFTSLRLRTHQR